MTAVLYHIKMLCTLCTGLLQFTRNNPQTTIHNQSAICKQLGSRWDADWISVASGSKLFDTQTTCLPNLRGIEALWKLKKTKNSAEDNLFGGLRIIYWIFHYFFVPSLNPMVWLFVRTVYGQNIGSGRIIAYHYLAYSLLKTILYLLQI